MSGAAILAGRFCAIAAAGGLLVAGLPLAPAIAQGPPGGGPGGPMQQSPADKLIASLPAPEAGGVMPMQPLPAGSPMPASDPHDLEGNWYHSQALETRMQKDMFGRNVPYTLAGAQVLAHRVDALAKGIPLVNASSICRPPGQTWQTDLNFSFHIYQTPKEIDIPFEEYHGMWKIRMEPAAAFSGKPEYMGYSTAHWDGSTLVVTTSHFKQGLWLDVDGTPASKDAVLTQRITKIDEGGPLLEIVTTVNDPVYYTHPWSEVRIYAWRPDKNIFAEYNCEEQVGLSGDAERYGLVPDSGQ